MWQERTSHTRRQSRWQTMKLDSLSHQRELTSCEENTCCWLTKNYSNNTCVKMIVLNVELTAWPPKRGWVGVKTKHLPWGKNWLCLMRWALCDVSNDPAAKMASLNGPTYRFFQSFKDMLSLTDSFCCSEIVIEKLYVQYRTCWTLQYKTATA